MERIRLGLFAISFWSLDMTTSNTLANREISVTTILPKCINLTATNTITCQINHGDLNFNVLLVRLRNYTNTHVYCVSREPTVINVDAVFNFSSTECNIPGIPDASSSSGLPRGDFNVSFVFEWGWNRPLWYIEMLSHLYCQFGYFGSGWRFSGKRNARTNLTLCGSPLLRTLPSPPRQDSNRQWLSNDPYFVCCDSTELQGLVIDFIRWKFGDSVGESARVEDFPTQATELGRQLTGTTCADHSKFIVTADSHSPENVTVRCETIVKDSEDQNQLHVMASKWHTFQVQGMPDVQIVRGSRKEDLQILQLYCVVSEYPALQYLFVLWYINDKEIRRENPQYMVLAELANRTVLASEYLLVVARGRTRVFCQRMTSFAGVPVLTSEVLIFTGDNAQDDNKIEGMASTERVIKEHTSIQELRNSSASPDMAIRAEVLKNTLLALAFLAGIGIVFVAAFVSRTFMPGFCRLKCQSLDQPADQTDDDSDEAHSAIEARSPPSLGSHCMVAETTA